jgi:hypothetical protein
MYTNFAANGYDWSLLYCDSVEKKISKGIFSIESLNMIPKIIGWDFWMYSFYLSKFAEYLDSFFLVIKGKSLVPPENSQVSVPHILSYFLFVMCRTNFLVFPSCFSSHCNSKYCLFCLALPL